MAKKPKSAYYYMADIVFISYRKSRVLEELLIETYCAAKVQRIKGIKHR